MLCPLLYVTHMSLIFCETHNRAVILTSFLANVQITALVSLCNDDIISAQTTYWRLQPVNTHFQLHSAIAVNLLNARNDLQLCVCFPINWLLFLSSLTAIFELIDCYFWTHWLLFLSSLTAIFELIDCYFWAHWLLFLNSLTAIFEQTLSDPLIQSAIGQRRLCFSAIDGFLTQRQL